MFIFILNIKDMKNKYKNKKNMKKIKIEFIKSEHFNSVVILISIVIVILGLMVANLFVQEALQKILILDVIFFVLLYKSSTAKFLKVRQIMITITLLIGLFIFLATIGLFVKKSIFYIINIIMLIVGTILILDKNLLKGKSK